MKLFLKYTILGVLYLFFCIGCSPRESSLPGYIEGEYTYISSGIAGTLYDLFVERGQIVQAGDALFRLDPEPEKATVQVSKANIGMLEAQLTYSKSQLARQKQLFIKHATPKSTLDLAQSDYDSKLQQLNAYKSELTQTYWSLHQKKIYTPVNGEISDTFYRRGERVPENHPILAILEPKNIKVLFYIPEKSLSLIHVGEEISFSCDSCNHTTAAKIIYISPEAEYTPPVIYSKDTRDKLVYLVRASMPDDTAKHFHPGQPIDVHFSL